MGTCLRVGSQEFTGEQLVWRLAKYEMLENLVGQLLLDSLLSRVKLSEEEVYKALCKCTDPDYSENIDINQFLANWLQENDAERIYLEQVVLRRLRLEKLKAEEFSQYIGAEFLRRKNEFDRVTFSLIRTPDPALAQELYYQIRDNSSRSRFGQLSRKFSTGSEKHCNGLIGPLAMSLLPINVQKVLSKSSEDVHPPIKVSNSCWIVRLEQFYSARLTEQLKQEIIDGLFSRWLNEKAKKLMSNTEIVQQTGN